MPTIITLHVFSGRPDPTWVLSDSDEAELTSRVHSLAERTPTKPSGVLGNLGYRGFSVRQIEAPQLSSRLYVHDGVVDLGQTEPNLTSPGGEIERWLLSTGREVVHPEVAKYVEESIGARPSADALWKLPHVPKPHPGCPKCNAVDAPAYNPGKWNIPTVQPYNNCYNYANDHITNTFAQPGRAHGYHIPYPNLQCNTVEPGAAKDGLHAANNFHAALPAGHGWYVALVVWPNQDYHWYRQDNVGCWSHKPGQTAARNVDNAGQPITDPKTCNRGPYTNFCTYMVTTRSVVIQ